MANNCANYITITGDPVLLEVIAKEYIGYDESNDTIDFTFDLMLPIPFDVLDDYKWRIDNWGNKWDGSDNYIDYTKGDSQIFVSVDTAWSPCDKWTYKLIELCSGVDIYHEYYEPGEGYIGFIEHNGGDDPEDFNEVCYTYSSDDYNYWHMVFEKEYESFEWLAEHIADCVDDETITKEVGEELDRLLDSYDNLDIIIRRCIEEEVL